MDPNLDVLGMSDEEFLKLSEPPAVSDQEADKVPEEEEVKKTEEGAEEPEAGDEQENDQAADAEEKPDETEEDPDEGEQDVAAAGEKAPFEGAESKQPAAKEPEKAPAEGAAKGEKPSQEQGKSESEGADYKAFYEQIMAPFKANGKLISLKSPDEVIQLMQMGANYTKKMQAIQPHKKYLMMLENNGLLDESKLSFLIDLDKKDPEAIKKLLKDNDIDPVDIDTSVEPNYKSGQHVVSDQEAALASRIGDLKDLPGGLDTIQSLNSLDSASKRILWNNPELLNAIHTQRESGIYDRITTEMERLQALGQIPVHTPFLHAYEKVGEAMQAQGAFADITTPPAPQVRPAAPGRTPLATRVQKSSTSVTDNQKVRAAAPPRSAPKVAKEAINPLAMSDEDFLKKFANRV